MSSVMCVAYFGLKFEVSPDEVEDIELRSDQRVAAARRHGLRYYFGNFGGPQERYLLLVGDQIGIMGPENSDAVDVLLDEIPERMDKTKAKLIEAGFEGAPALHLQWHPDV